MRYEEIILLYANSLCLDSSNYLVSRKEHLQRFCKPMISASGRVSDEPLALTVPVKMHDTNSYWSTEKQHTWLASASFSNFKSQVFLKNCRVEVKSIICFLSFSLYL